MKRWMILALAGLVCVATATTGRGQPQDEKNKPGEAELQVLKVELDKAMAESQKAQVLAQQKQVEAAVARQKALLDRIKMLEVTKELPADPAYRAFLVAAARQDAAVKEKVAYCGVSTIPVMPALTAQLKLGKGMG